MNKKKTCVRTIKNSQKKSEDDGYRASWQKTKKTFGRNNMNRSPHIETLLLIKLVK